MIWGQIPLNLEFFPNDVGWFPISVQGPMARTVADTALLLSAMAGPDARSPISLSEPGQRFREPLDRDFKGVRIAWSRDFGGLPIDPRVTAAIDQQRGVFESLGNGMFYPGKSIKFTGPMYQGVTGEDLLDQCGTGSRHAYDEYR